jgi:hypothetical protein
MSSSLLEEVRQSCRIVAQQARFVEIDTGALAGYAALLPADRLRLPEMDPAIHFLGHGPDTVAYLLTLDAINFGSGYFPDIFADPRRSGYRAIAAALKEHFTQFGPLAPQQLRRLTAEECAVLVALSPSAEPARELILLYTRALNELGALLCDRFGAEFQRLVQEAGESAERLVQLLTALPLFNDFACYHGSRGKIRVPFYKRAQLAAVDLYLAFAGQGPGRFQDIERITVCADNLVPHVLRLDGVLRYGEELAARIDSGEPIAAGSPEEVEIRACAVHAGELLVAELKRRGTEANALLLDNYLWHRGQQPYYRARARHRTRTPSY